MSVKLVSFRLVFLTGLTCVFVGKQEEEEAAEGEAEAEGASRAEDGSSRGLHRRYQRCLHVFSQRHQEGSGKKPAGLQDAE